MGATFALQATHWMMHRRVGDYQAAPWTPVDHDTIDFDLTNVYYDSTDEPARSRRVPNNVW